jgi:hypothetical protein
MSPTKNSKNSTPLPLRTVPVVAFFFCVDILLFDPASPVAAASVSLLSVLSRRSIDPPGRGWPCQRAVRCRPSLINFSFPDASLLEFS